MIPIDFARVESIIEPLADQFTTADVLRGYIGHFHKDKGTPVWYSFNAWFGKYLSHNREDLWIEKIGPISVVDDCGERTQATQWRKL